MVFKVKYFLLAAAVALMIGMLTYCSDEGDGIPVLIDSPVQYKGVSFAVHKQAFTSAEFDAVEALHANAVCLMPFAFGEFGSPELSYDRGFQWWGETTPGIIASAEYAREKGLKVLLKPHIWFWHGEFTGDFSLEQEADWQAWEANYSNYILHFARLADSLDLEAFCIGVELKTFIAKRPAYWQALIAAVRQVYDGKLVYAANWDNFKHIGFWDQLDYIGIDAYFPLSDEKTPGLDSLLSGWNAHFGVIETIAKQWGKPVLFTEYGYKSIDYTAHIPWNPEEGGVNMAAQYNAYEAVFKKFWDTPWFGGGFLWKWFPNHTSSGGTSDKDYTPQNKPAEELIRERYKQ